MKRILNLLLAGSIILSSLPVMAGSKNGKSVGGPAYTTLSQQQDARIADLQQEVAGLQGIALAKVNEKLQPIQSQADALAEQAEPLKNAALSFQQRSLGSDGSDQPGSGSRGYCNRKNMAIASAIALVAAAAIITATIVAKKVIQKRKAAKQ